MRPIPLCLSLVVLTAHTFADEPAAQAPQAADEAPLNLAPPAISEPPAAAPATPFDLNGKNSLTPAESMAWRDLRDVVIRERAIWDRLLKSPEDEHEQSRANAEFRTVITAYENVIRASPKFAEAYAAYGLLLNRTGNRDQGVRVLVQANQLNPALPMVKNEIGNYLFEEGRYKDALGYYLAAIELKDTEPLYHYQLGSLLREYRRFFIADGIFNPPTIDEKMQGAFRRAAELAPETWGYAYRYAESFYDIATPDWPAALAEWTRLEAKAKPGIEKQTIQVHQAHVLARMGRTDEARQLIDSITEPSLASAREQVQDVIDAPPPSVARSEAEHVAPPPALDHSMEAPSPEAVQGRDASPEPEQAAPEPAHPPQD